MKKLERILLVDDDRITNYVNQNLISKYDYAAEIITRNSAKDALTYLQQDCKNEEKYPQLILLDLKMPGMDGFDFLKEFENFFHDLKENIIIVILTTSQAADDVIRLRELGNYFLINKPLTGDKLFDIHHRFFRFMNPPSSKLA